MTRLNFMTPDHLQSRLPSRQRWMISDYRYGPEIPAVVNAANAAKDWAWFSEGSKAALERSFG